MGQNKRLARKGAKKPEATKNEAVKIEGEAFNHSYQILLSEIN